jgi:tripartite-type tricarboxylate transporter receptor subunit TctC
MRTHNLFSAFIAGACIALATPAFAASFPTKPVMLTVGFAPGGNADTVARLLAREMSTGLGNQVIIDSKPGAGGNIAAATVAKANPDGHTLLLVTGGHAVSGALYKSLQYKSVESFAPVSLVTTFPFLIVSRSDGADATLAAMLARAKANPGRVTFGSAGTGSTQHLTGELLNSMAGTKITHVPYKGDAAALVGLLGGQIDLVIASPTALIAQIKAGKVKALAVSGNARWSQLPGVPTVAEAGVPSFDVQSWLGLAATAGTPAAVVDRLHAEVVRILKIPTVRSSIEGLGSEPRTSTPEELRSRMAGELQRWTRVIEEAKIERE